MNLCPLFLSAIYDIPGSGFRVLGSEVQGSGFTGSGFNVQGQKVKAQGSKLKGEREVTVHGFKVKGSSPLLLPNQHQQILMLFSDLDFVRYQKHQLP